MNSPFERRKERLFNLTDLTVEKMLVVIFPRMMIEIIRRYLRVEVEGLENIPKKGPVLLCPNHSGFAGLDALMISYIIFREIGRIPRILAHRAFFDWFPSGVGKLAHKMGMEKASLQNGEKLLKTNHLVMIFPEGESGNFKPTSKAYQLQKYHKGFARMGLSRKGTVVVPCVVIGAEETHINLGQLKFSKYLSNILLPLPLNVLPLPAKWKIKFLPPICLSGYSTRSRNNRKVLDEIAENLQLITQKAIDKELKSRRYVFFNSKVAKRFGKKKARTIVAEKLGKKFRKKTKKK